MAAEMLCPPLGATLLEHSRDHALQNSQVLIFTPDLLTESGKTTYRFSCPGPGAFQCAVTGLVFVMDDDAELTYKTVQWDESLIKRAGKIAAGLLFDITCSEDDTVTQLWLPHCETKDALLLDDILSVVHITDDGMSISDRLRITETHVVVEVPHLSVFGLVWDYIKRFRNISLPIYGQVLLFLRPPRIGHPVLDVFLLQNNIPLDEVANQQEDAVNLKISSDCLLVIGKSYFLSCEPEALPIQPKHVQFDSKTGANFFPTFEVFLTTNPEKVTLTVQDQEKQEVWRRDVYLKGLRGKTPKRDASAADRVPPRQKVPPRQRVLLGQRFQADESVLAGQRAQAVGSVPPRQRVPAGQWFQADGSVLAGQRAQAVGRVPTGQKVQVDESVPPEKRLFSVRLEFIRRVSEPILDQLLDELYQRKVLNFQEMRTIKKKPEGKAGDVIDAVQSKGSVASSILIATICRLDEHLASELNLR